MSQHTRSTLPTLSRQASRACSCCLTACTVLRIMTADIASSKAQLCQKHTHTACTLQHAGGQDSSYVPGHDSGREALADTVDSRSGAKPGGRSCLQPDNCNRAEPCRSLACCLTAGQSHAVLVQDWATPTLRPVNPRTRQGSATLPRTTSLPNSMLPSSVSTATLQVALVQAPYPALNLAQAEPCSGRRPHIPTPSNRLCHALQALQMVHQGAVHSTHETLHLTCGTVQAQRLA